MNFKQHKTHSSNFTIIPNSIFKDKNLSNKAKGLLCLMLSLPPTWDFSESGLSMLSHDNLSSIRSTIKELEKAGYLYRERVRNKKGHLKGTIYHIFESPTFEKPTLENQTLDKPKQEKPKYENHTQLNTNISITNRLRTEDNYEVDPTFYYNWMK